MATGSDFRRRPPPNGVMMAFRLDGKAKLAPLPPQEPAPYVISDDRFTPAQLAEGQKWYFTYCTICHEGPVNPNLLRSPVAADRDAWKTVLIDGALSSRGMISFKPYLTAAQAEAVRGYVVETARSAASATAGAHGRSE